MAVNVLPKPDRRHLLQFYFFPRLSYGVRLSLSFALILAGLILQLAATAATLVLTLFVSVPLILLGNLLLLARGFDSTPKTEDSTRTWEKTTRDRFLAAKTLDDASRRWDETLLDITCKTGFFFFVLVTGTIVFFYFLLQSDPRTRLWAPAFAWDAAVLLFPYWVTGTRRGWRPVSLRQEIEALETVLETLDRFKEPPCQIQCMFETVGEDKKKVPVSARVFVRFPEAPEGFLGVQFQVALNDVQGTKYPYLYAVLVARKEFRLMGSALKTVAAHVKPPLIFEKNSEDDVDVIVIRQKTTRNSGYHTKPSTIRKITETAWKAVQSFSIPG